MGNTEIRSNRVEKNKKEKKIVMFLGECRTFNFKIYDPWYTRLYASILARNILSTSIVTFVHI